MLNFGICVNVYLLLANILLIIFIIDSILIYVFSLIIGYSFDLIKKEQRKMAGSNETLKIICATTENFNLLYDGLENYFIFYDGKQVADKITDKTKPKGLLKIIDENSYKDIEEKGENPTIKGLINAISLEYDKPHQKLRVLRQIIKDLINVMEDESLYLTHFKKADQVVREFIINLTSDYGYDNTLFDNEFNPGNISEFDKIFNSYDSWYDMLETELYDYVDNTENVFKGIINSLCALFGYGSRFIVVNGGSEVGKSEFVGTIKKLMPNFKNLGSSTPASIRRQDEYAFDRTNVYLGDKGLKGKSQASQEEFEGLYEVFGGLITDKEFKRDIVVGDKVIEFNLKSDGVCVFYTQPYTNLRVFGAGDQYSTRSTFIIVKPVEDGLSVFLQDENLENKFYEIHKNYIRAILNNPVTLTISNTIKTALWQASRESLRTAKYLLGLFKAYCQYMRIANPIELDVNNFLDVFKPKYEVTEIEFLVYKKLYGSLNVLSNDDVDYLISDDGEIELDNMLLQMKDRKNKSFFTYKQIQTYFKKDFKHNKNLKDTLDNIASILHNLFSAGLLNKIEWQHNGREVYYIPYNADMEK